MDGRDRHAFRGDVIGSFGQVVFGDPVVQEAPFIKRFSDEQGQIHAGIILRGLHGIDHRHLREGVTWPPRNTP